MITENMIDEVNLDIERKPLDMECVVDIKMKRITGEDEKVKGLIKLGESTFNKEEEIEIDNKKKPDTEVSEETKVKKKPELKTEEFIDAVNLEIKRKPKDLEYISEDTVDAETDTKPEKTEKLLKLKEITSEDIQTEMDVRKKPDTEIEVKTKIKKKPGIKTEKFIDTVDLENVSKSKDVEYISKDILELKTDSKPEKDKKSEALLELKETTVKKEKETKIDIKKKSDSEIELNVKKKPEITIDKKSASVIIPESEKDSIRNEQLSSIDIFEAEVVDTISETKMPDKGTARVSFITHEPLTVADIIPQGKEISASISSPTLQTASSIFDEMKAITVSMAESETREERFVDKVDLPKKATIEFMTKNHIMITETESSDKEGDFRKETLSASSAKSLIMPAKPMIVDEVNIQGTVSNLKLPVIQQHQGSLALQSQESVLVEEIVSSTKESNLITETYKPQSLVSDLKPLSHVQVSEIHPEITPIDIIKASPNIQIATSQITPQEAMVIQQTDTIDIGADMLVDKPKLGKANERIMFGQSVSVTEVFPQFKEEKFNVSVIPHPATATENFPKEDLPIEVCDTFVLGDLKDISADRSSQNTANVTFETRENVSVLEEVLIQHEEKLDTDLIVPKVLPIFSVTSGQAALVSEIELHEKESNYIPEKVKECFIRTEISKCEAVKVTEVAISDSESNLILPESKSEVFAKTTLPVTEAMIVTEEITGGLQNLQEAADMPKPFKANEVYSSNFAVTVAETETAESGKLLILGNLEMKSIKSNFVPNEAVIIEETGTIDKEEEINQVLSPNTKKASSCVVPEHAIEILTKETFDKETTLNEQKSKSFRAEENIEIIDEAVQVVSEEMEKEEKLMLMKDIIKSTAVTEYSAYHAISVSETESQISEQPLADSLKIEGATATASLNAPVSAVEVSQTLSVDQEGKWSKDWKPEGRYASKILQSEQSCISITETNAAEEISTLKTEISRKNPKLEVLLQNAVLVSETISNIKEGDIETEIKPQGTMAEKIFVEDIALEVLQNELVSKEGEYKAKPLPKGNKLSSRTEYKPTKAISVTETQANVMEGILNLEEWVTDKGKIRFGENEALLINEVLQSGETKELIKHLPDMQTANLQIPTQEALQVLGLEITDTENDLDTAVIPKSSKAKVNLVSKEAFSVTEVDFSDKEKSFQDSSPAPKRAITILSTEQALEVEETEATISEETLKLKPLPSLSNIESIYTPVKALQISEVISSSNTDVLDEARIPSEKIAYTSVESDVGLIIEEITPSDNTMNYNEKLDLSNEKSADFSVEHLQIVSVSEVKSNFKEEEMKDFVLPKADNIDFSVSLNQPLEIGSTQTNEMESNLQIRAPTMNKALLSVLGSEAFTIATVETNDILGDVKPDTYPSATEGNISFVCSHPIKILEVMSNANESELDTEILKTPVYAETTFSSHHIPLTVSDIQPKTDAEKLNIMQPITEFIEPKINLEEPIEVLHITSSENTSDAKLVLSAQNISANYSLIPQHAYNISKQTLLLTENKLIPETLASPKMITPSLIPHESIQIHMSETSMTECNLKPDILPESQIAQQTLPNVDHLLVEDTIAHEFPQLSDQQQPDKRTAKPSIVCNNQLAVIQESVTGTFESQLASDVSPVTHSANIQILPEKSLEVSIIQSETKESDLVQEERISKTNAMISLPSTEALILEEVITSLNADDYKLTLPFTDIAKLKFTNLECPSVTEVKTAETESELEIPIIPQKHKPNCSIISLETVIVSEIKTGDITDALEKIAPPQSKFLKPIFTPLEICVIEEATVSGSEGNLQMKDRPKLQKASHSYETLQAPIVSETILEDTEETFKPQTMDAAFPKVSMPGKFGLEVSDTLLAEQEKPLITTPMPKTQTAENLMCSAFAINVQESGISDFTSPAAIENFSNLKVNADVQVTSNHPISISETASEFREADLHEEKITSRQATLSMLENITASVEHVAICGSSGELKPDLFPTTHKLQTIVVPQKSITVAEVQWEQKEDFFEREKLYPQDAKTEITLTRALEILECSPETKEQTLHAEIMPEVHEANVKMPSEEAITVIEVCADEKARKLSIDSFPKEDVANLALSPFETVVIEEQKQAEKESDGRIDEIPQFRTAQKVLPIEKHLEISEVTAAAYYEQLIIDKVPKETKADVQLPIQQSLLVSETTSGSKEEIFIQPVSPKSQKVEPDITAIEPLYVSVTESEIKENELSVEMRPKESQAIINFNPEGSIQICEVQAHLKEGVFLPSKPSVAISAPFSIPTAEHVVVSEVQTSSQEEELIKQEIPKSFQADVSLPSESHIVVSEIETELKEEEYVPQKIASKLSIGFTVPSEEHILVSQVDTEFKEDILKPEKKPTSVHADVQIPTTEHVTVSDVVVDLKEGIFDSMKIPKTASASCSLPTEEHVCISDVILSQKEGKLQELKLPDTLTVSFILPTEKHVTISQTEVSMKEGELIKEKLPETVTAKLAVPCSDHVVVSMTSSGEFEDNLNIEKLPKPLNADFSVPTEEHVVVSEIQTPLSEDILVPDKKPLEFSAEETLTLGEHILVSEVETASKESVIEEIKIPKTDTAGVLLNTEEHVFVSYVQPDVKEQDYTPELKPAAQNVKVSFPADEHITVYEVTSGSSEKELPKDIKPVSVKADLTVLTKDSIITSTVETSLKEAILDKDKTPVTAQAISSVPAETHVIISTTETDDKEGELLPIKLPSQLHLDYSLSTSEHVIIGETLSQTSEKELKPELLPSAVAADMSLLKEEHVTVSQVISDIKEGVVSDFQVPATVNIDYSVNTEEHLIVGKIDVQTMESELTPSKLPATITANFSMLTQETVEISEVPVQDKESDLALDKTPQTIIAKVSIPSQECVSVSEVQESSQTEDIIITPSPLPMEAEVNIPSETHVIISEMITSQKEGEVMPLKKPQEMKAGFTIPTVEHIVVSDVTASNKEKDLLKDKELPHSIADFSIRQMEHIIVSQVETQSMEEDFKEPIKPSTITADFSIPTVEHVVVSETEFDLKETELDEFKKPKESHVDVTLPVDEHIQVLEIESSVKEIDFVPDKTPSTVQAPFTLTTDKHITVTQTEFRQTEEFLSLETKPLPHVADFHIPTVEHVVISETKADAQEAELEEFKMPKESHVNVTIPAKEHIEIREIEIDVKEKELMPEKLPATGEASFSIPTDEHIIISQTESHQKEDLLSVKEKPSSVIADFSVPTVEHLVISEMQLDAKESEIGEFQKPKESHVNITVPVQEHIEVSEVEIDTKEKDLIPEKMPAIVQPLFTVPTDEHIIIMQADFHQKEDTLNLETKPISATAGFTIPTVEHVVISETQHDLKESKLDVFKKPKESHADVTVPLEEHIEVYQIETDIKENHLASDKIPESVQASFSMPTDEHVIVMQTESHQKEDTLSLDRRPSEVNIDFTVSSKKHVIISQVLTETKEEELISKDLPKKATADLSVSSKEHLIITETQFESSEKALKIDESPSPVTAGCTVPAKEYIEVSQIQPQSREFELTLEKKPKEETAGVSMPTETHFEVSEVESHVKPEDIIPEKIPDSIKADVTVPTIEHVIISETESNLRVKEFSTTKPTSGKAKQTLAVKEPIKVDEVPGEVSIEQQVTFPKKVEVTKKKDVDQSFLEFVMEEASEFSVQKPKEKTAQIIEEPLLEEEKIKEVGESIMDEFSPFTVTLPEEETVEETVDSSVTKKRTVKVHKKMKGGKVVEVKEIVETFSSVPSEASKPIIEDITETDTEFLQPISSKEPVIEEVEESLPSKTEITDVPSEISAVIEEPVEEEVDDSITMIKKKPKRKIEKQPLSKDESSEEDTGKTVVKLKKKKSIVEEIGIISAAKPLKDVSSDEDSDKTVVKLKKKKSIVEEIGIIPAPKSDEKEKEQIVSIPNIETMKDDVEILIEESEDVLPKSKAKISREGPEVFVSEVSETKTETPILPVDNIDKEEDTVDSTKLKLKKGKKPVTSDETKLLKEQTKKETDETTEVKFKPKRKSIVAEESDTTLHVPSEKVETDFETDILKHKVEDEITFKEDEVKAVKKKKPKTEEKTETKIEVAKEDEKIEPEIILSEEQQKEPVKPKDSSEKTITLKKKPKEISDTEIKTIFPKKEIAKEDEKIESEIILSKEQEELVIPEDSSEKTIKLKKKPKEVPDTQITTDIPKEEIVKEDKKIEPEIISSKEQVEPVKPEDSSEKTIKLKKKLKEVPDSQITADITKEEIVKEDETIEPEITSFKEKQEEPIKPEDSSEKTVKLKKKPKEVHDTKIITSIPKEKLSISETEENLLLTKGSKSKSPDETETVKLPSEELDEIITDEKIEVHPKSVDSTKLIKHLINEGPFPETGEITETFDESTSVITITKETFKNDFEEITHEPSKVEQHERKESKVSKISIEDTVITKHGVTISRTQEEVTFMKPVSEETKPLSATAEKEEVPAKEEPDSVEEEICLPEEPSKIVEKLQEEQFGEEPKSFITEETETVVESVRRIKKKPKEDERKPSVTEETEEPGKAVLKLKKKPKEEEKPVEATVEKKTKPEKEKSEVTEETHLIVKKPKEKEIKEEQIEAVIEATKPQEMKIEEISEEKVIQIQKKKKVEPSEAVIERKPSIEEKPKEITEDALIKMKKKPKEEKPTTDSLEEKPQKKKPEEVEDKAVVKIKKKVEKEDVVAETIVERKPSLKEIHKEETEEKAVLKIKRKASVKQEEITETDIVLPAAEKTVSETVETKETVKIIKEIAREEKPQQSVIDIKRKPSIKTAKEFEEKISPEGTDEFAPEPISFDTANIKAVTSEAEEKHKITEISVLKSEEKPKIEETAKVILKKKPTKKEEAPIEEFKVPKPEKDETKVEESEETFSLNIQKPKDVQHFDEEKTEIVIKQTEEIKYAVEEAAADLKIKKQVLIDEPKPLQPEISEVSEKEEKVKIKRKPKKEEPITEEIKIVKKPEERPEKVDTDEEFKVEIPVKPIRKEETMEETELKLVTSEVKETTMHVDEQKTEFTVKKFVEEIIPKKPETAQVEEKPKEKSPEKKQISEITVQKEEETPKEEVVKTTVKMKKKPKVQEEMPEVAEFKIPQKPAPEEGKPKDVAEEFELKFKPREEEKPDIIEETSEIIELKPEKPEEYTVVEEKAEVTIKKKEIPKEEEDVKTILKMKKKPKKLEEKPEIAEFKIPEKPEPAEEKPEEVEEAFELKIRPKEEEKPETVEGISEVIELKPEKPKEYIVAEEKAEITVKKKEIQKEEEVVKTVKMKKKPKIQEEKPEVAEFKIPQKPEPAEEKPEEVEEAFELKIRPKEEEKPETVEEISEVIELKPEKPKEYIVAEEKAEITVKKKEIQKEEEVVKTVKMKKKPKIQEEKPEVAEFKIPQKPEPAEEKPEEVEEAFELKIRPKEEEKSETVEEISEVIELKPEKPKEYIVAEEKAEITVKKKEIQKEEEVVKTVKMKKKPKIQEEKPEVAEFKIPQKPEPEEEKPKEVEEAFKLKIKPKEEVKPEITEEISEIIALKPEKPEEYTVVEEKAEITVKKKEFPKEEEEVVKTTVKMKKKPKKPEEQPEVAEFKISQKPEPEEEKPEEVEEAFELKIRPKEAEKSQIIEEISEVIELKAEKPKEYTVVEEKAEIIVKKKEVKEEEEVVKTVKMKKKPKIQEEKPEVAEFKIPQKAETTEEIPEEIEEAFELKIRPKVEEKPQVVEEISEKIELKPEKPEKYSVVEEVAEVTIKKEPPIEKVPEEEKPETTVIKRKKKVIPERKKSESPIEETFAIPLIEKKESSPEEVSVEEKFTVGLKKQERKVLEETVKVTVEDKKVQEYKTEEVSEEITVKKVPEKPKEPVKKEEIEVTKKLKLKKKTEPKTEEKPVEETFAIPVRKEEPIEEEAPVEEKFSLKLKEKVAVTEEKIAEESFKLVIQEEKPKPKEEVVAEETTVVLKPKEEPKRKPSIKEEVEEKTTLKLKPKKKEPEKKTEDMAETFKIPVSKKPDDEKRDEEKSVEEEFKVTIPKKKKVVEDAEEEAKIIIPAPVEKERKITEVSEEITIKKKGPVEEPKITKDDEQRISIKKPKKKVIEDDVKESFTIDRKKSIEETKKIEGVEETFQIKTVPKKKPKEVSEEEDSLKITLPETKKTETTEENVEITVKKKVTKEEEQKVSIKKPKKKVEDEKVAESFTVSRKQSIEEQKHVEDVEETFQIKTTPKKKPHVFSEDEESLSISLSSEKRDYKTEEVSEETKVTLKRTEKTKEELEEILEVTEYVAISSFVAEKSDSVSLVEGERVEVIEKTSQDWWFVRKVVTNEKGFVPPSVLEDSATYTHYMKDTLSKKIEKLPVLRKPKPGEKMTAPKFVKKLTPMKVVDGQTAEISCQVTGNPRPTITWFKQTQIIKPSMEFQIFYDEDNVTTLIIREVFPEDAGTYTVVAKNAAGFASCSADLIVDTPFSDHGSETFPSSRLSLSRQSSLTDILEGIPPVFAEKPKDKKVDEGKPVELVCKVTGIPEPKITWLRNQKPLKESDRIEITTVTEDLDITKVIVTIKTTKIEDAGTYEIIAENREGKSVTSLILNVTEKPKKPKEEPPVFSQTYSDVICSEKDTVSLTVKVQGTPTPEVTWYKNGKELKPSKNVTQTVKDDVCTLTVFDSKESDTGEYKCVAKNPKGTVEHTSKVTVQKTGVDFVEKLYDVEVKERETALFSIEVSHPTAQVTWHKDGEKLKPTDRMKFVEDGCTRKLIVEDANVNDEGEYTCVLGEKECTAELVVVELPPDFKGEMKDVTVAKEQSATFQVELTKGDARARWFKDNKEIEFSEHVMLKIDGKRQKLIIYNTTFEDAGTYTCVVGNKKRTAKLKVEAPTVEFTAKLPDKITVPQDTDVSFTVELSRPDVPVQWLKNGSPIPEKEKDKFQFIKERNVYKLIVQRAQKDDAAEYSCVAGNVKTTTKLQVQEAHAEFTLKLRDVIVRESDTATLLVEVTRETFEVRWMKDGQTIKPTDRMIMEKEGCRRRLIIKDTTLEDRGMYTCVLDEKTCSSTLTVETTPRVVSEKRHYKGKKGSNVVVDVEFMALPQPKIEWLYKGKPITADKKRSIENYGNKTVVTIKKIEDSDVGDYTLKLTNKCGETKTDFTVSIIDKPKPPGMPNASEIANTSLTLSWKVPDSDGGSPITNYLIEYHDRNTLRWSTYNESFTINQPYSKVEKLKEGEEYMFRIIAVNEVGKSDPSPGTKYILVQEPKAGEPPAVVEHLKPITCGLKKPATLTCRISGQPPPAIKWFKNGKEIPVLKTNMTATYENQIATLKISQTDDKSAGTYACKASNPLGSVETSSELTIQEPPTIQYDESMKNVRLKSHSEYILDIKVFGYPSPELVWFKNGKVLESTKHTLVQMKEDSTTITIRSLENTDSATYTLQLTNPAGTVKYDFRLFVLDKPLPPEGPIAFHKIEKTSVTIGWQPPSIGGSEVLSYVIEKCEVRRKVWIEVTTVKSDVLTQEITDLSEGIEYAFRVIATNEYGRSDPLTSDPVAPKSLFDKPHAPKGPFTTSNMTENSFTLSWLAPDNDGGSPIIEYIVERKEANKKAWQRVAATDGKTLSVEVTALKKDTAYHFRVCCRNEIGHSPYFAPDETITPGLKISPPSSPVGPLAILNMTNKTVTLSWQPPANTGGADLTAYIIEKRESTKTTWNRLETLEPHVTTYTVHNLTHKKEYFFRVFAENPAGLSPPLETDKPIKLTSTAVRPSPPTDPLEVVVTGPSSILLSWGRPESDGGSPILGYTVAMKNVRRIMWMEVGQVDGETQRLQVKDLQEGSEYMVRIMARNEVGVSDPLEPEDPVKMIRPPGFKESEKPEVDEKTISVSYSTETSSSWIREANVEPLLRSYTKHVLAGRNEYFFRIWHLAESIFK